MGLKPRLQSASLPIGKVDYWTSASKSASPENSTRLGETNKIRRDDASDGEKEGPITDSRPFPFLRPRDLMICMEKDGRGGWFAGDPVSDPNGPPHVAGFMLHQSMRNENSRSTTC